MPQRINWTGARIKVIVAAFDVPGQPVPQSRPRVFSTGAVKSDSDRVAVWKRAVRAECKLGTLRRKGFEMVRPRVPLGVDLEFRFPRPRSHFQKGPEGPEVRPGSPIWHTGTPDKDNLEKAILDALGRHEGCPPLLWADDAQVVVGYAEKRYCNPGEDPGALVVVYRVETLAMGTEIFVQPPPTAGERLELARRRADMTQADAADVLGVSARTLRYAEAGKGDIGIEFERPLLLYEKCYILRKRAGLTLQQLSEATGLAVVWLSRVERGRIQRGAETLGEWWSQHLANGAAG